MARLQAERAPDTRDGSLIETRCFRHLPRAPMRCVGELALQRVRNDFVHLRAVNFARLAGTGRIEQTVERKVDKPPPPLSHPLYGHAQALRAIPDQLAMRAQRQRLPILAASRPFDQAIVSSTLSINSASLILVSSRSPMSFRESHNGSS